MDEMLAVLSHTDDGVYAVDRAQCIMFWNASAERLLGYSAAEVLGRHCHEVFDGEPRPGCLECASHCPVMTAAAQHESVPTYNLLSRTKSGETILLNVSVIVPVQDESPYVSIHLFRDATHQLRYETYVEHILCAAARLPHPPAPMTRSTGEALLIHAPLSGREKEVLYLLVQGKAARDIAETLYISYATVRNHLHTILRKLGVHSQREAVRLALEHHLV
ncbi:MAG: LuxR C-terminal-related transcriptional regulator [Candidatus Tectimicrobiota bacterium]